MLELKNITKDYKIGGGVVNALRGVSIDFRESEFVSILGQSGCGKTTLLNIIGGLDRYTDGDLVIGGKSTKQFKNADWDTYRNHSIGFVFQSYNLIPHQTVLSNVELALTLSGVSKTERRKRAKEALEKVGLGDQLNKKPNQMSGGQMQRVAIARALVNDPDILLADEPTGALDSDTSIQIMEILKEISADKLIIMVTHNPELAEQYSSRIIRLLDGKVIDDSNPYSRNVVEPIEKDKKQEKKLKKPSMSFFTALSLSLNNLMTKKARTFMTSFAGSIGIIGIALILAISSGARAYIASVEEDTLSSYPIMIESSSVDMATMMTSMAKTRQESLEREPEDNTIYSLNVMGNMINTMFSQIQSNDLKSFKAYLEGDGNKINDYVSDIKYEYATPMNIYRADTEDGIFQVNPAQLFDKLGMTNEANSAAAMSTVMNSTTGVWSEMLDNDDLMKSQYQLLKGSYPKNYDEVVIIVNERNELTDYSLYCLGLMDEDDLVQAVKNAFAGNTDKIDFESNEVTFTFDELMELDFRLVVNSDYFVKENGVWVDKSEDTIYMTDVVNNAEKIKVVGIVKPQENAILSTNSSVAVGYTHALTEYLINKVNDSEIVKEQKDNPDVDVFTGIEFPDPDEEEPEITMEDLNAYIMTLPQEQQMAIMQQLQQAQEMGMTEQQIIEAFKQNMPDNSTDATYDGNLTKMGVSSLDSPYRINIYPKDFESKEEIEAIIDEYNDGVEEELEIRYTDIVGLMMTSVTTIIDAISYILIAFVAISLIVSSIMIGIITYVSVLERTKEIGILRAMGASKRDISRVFNAETLIVGFAAGAIGIGVTLLLSIPINIIIEQLAEISGICALPWQGGVILVIISMLLTLIAGLIPAKVAANKDPVAALRTE
ncbi:MAG: ABC transporter ATP-binding protein/permease [Eubacterium sp.]|nr:ABC transporter ATP-binding protein/permease [Eubacterium sp.]